MPDQQPPPYGGHPNYGQQWPAYASIITSNAYNRADYGTPNGPPPNAAPKSDNHMAALNANAQLAGPGGSTNPALFFPPPPFSFFNQFDPSQLPSFPQMPYPAMGFPPPLLPTGSSNPPAAHPSMYPQGSQQPPASNRSVNRVIDQADSSREEGEVSEENEETSLPQKPLAAGQGSEMEEEEAASSGARSSGRSSGSPYNPPLSMSVDTGAVHHAMQSQKRDAPATITKTPQSQKSAAQLRIQAQGALLSLAPHHIRFNELVAEGINPVVLRQLYEEVGIKVVTSTEQAPAQAESNPAKVTGAIEAPKKQVEATRTANEKRVLAKANILVPQSSGSSAAAPPSSEKPLERKELIAQMLAAKAAKAAPSPAGSIKSAPTPPSNVTPPAPKELPAKERSKAQTELARQRIEELRRNALRKTQLAAQLDQAAVSSPPQAPVIQHPLPLRPPVPELYQPAGLPGLVMTESAQEPDESSAPELLHDVSVDPTPVSRTSQRKRPRASDFDETIAPPKKPFTPVSGYFTPTDRLVIAISDDESLYGDDEDDNMDIDSSPGEEPVSSGSATAHEAALQQQPSITRASTSTPQVPSSSEQGDIRLKDMEIQAMRRKIAELELRRKSKLAASRTQSPRTLDDSGTSSSGGQSFAADVGMADTPAAPTSVPTPPSSCLADRSDIIDSFSDSSIRVLAAMDKEQLNSMQSKILRMKDIESGHPDLDAGISSTESRLSVCRQEAEALISDITKEREDRYQLVEELKGLSYEINGLSSEDLNELRRQAEIKKQHLPAPEASRSSPPTLSTVIPDDSGREPEDTLGSQVPAQETSTSYQTDSAGSAMDESDDSSSDEPDSSSDDEPASSPVQADIPATVPEFSMPMDIDSSNESESASSPSAAAHSDAEPVYQHSSQHEDSERSVRETSAVSDAYEPPEPETDAQSEGSSYSPPPFSPAPPSPPSPPAPVENTATSAPSIDITQADEALTNDHQVPAQLPQSDSQVGVLGTQESSASSGKRFTPYKSPLRNFKAYRYHPNYAEDVSSGHRSLTYSHNIDSMQYLCPYELAGGVCNDRSCEFQHFRDMTLSDDKILVQMGAVREGETEEEKENYLAGLKEIINDMRRDKVKDFDIVAAEIAAYRRRFLKDPSRVLPL